MLGNHNFSLKNWFSETNAIQKIGFLASFLMVVGLSISPALISIGSGLILLPLFLDYQNLKKNLQSLQSIVYSGAIILFLLHFVDIFFHVEQSQQFWNEIRIKLPFVMIPLGFLAYRPHPNDFFYLSFAFLLTLSVVAFLTFVNYLTHFEEMNLRILESKEIPVVTKVTHIYFSAMMAFGVFLSFFGIKGAEVFYLCFWGYFYSFAFIYSRREQVW